MNERIDELIEECTSVNDDLVYDGRDSYMKTTEYFDKEKFAELVEAAARADEREQIAAWYEAEGQMTFPVAIPKIIRARGTT